MICVGALEFRPVIDSAREAGKDPFSDLCTRILRNREGQVDVSIDWLVGRSDPAETGEFG